MKSNKPYLINAIYQWCLDCDFIPHIVVDASMTNCNFPGKKEGERRLVFNISKKAVKDFEIIDEKIIFYANFSQKVEKITFETHAVYAIYAYENGEGITFDEDFDVDDEDGEGGLADLGYMEVMSSHNDVVMVNKKTPQLTIIK